MRNRSLVTIYFLLLCTDTLLAQSFLAPVINENGIVNAATFRAEAVTQGMIISIFGRDLSDGTSATASSLPLPKSLAGTTVLIGGNPAPLFFVSPTQINAQVPWGVTFGGIGTAMVTVQVRVKREAEEKTSPVASALYAGAAPGIFNAGNSRITAIIRATNSELVCPSGHTSCQENYVRPGEIISVYATGLGAVIDGPLDGEPPTGVSRISSVRRVAIGGVFSQILFAGLAPGFVGLYQINLVVPSNVLSGDEVPLVLSIGNGMPAQTTLAIRGASPGITNIRRRGGPTIGSLTSLAADPTHPRQLYAGSSYGGVFYSPDFGNIWFPRGMEGTTPFVVNALAVDPSDGQRLFALTNFGELFGSTDGGGGGELVRAAGTTP